MIRNRSTIQLHLHTPPNSNLSFPLSLFFLFHPSLCLSIVLHKCQLPYQKAFCADLRGSLYRSHYKSLTPVTLLCWYSSTIFYFVCFVTECFGPRPRKGTLGLSKGLTGMKCELQPSGSRTIADLCDCVLLFSFSDLSDNFSPHILMANEKKIQNNIRKVSKLDSKSFKTQIKRHLEAKEKTFTFWELGVLKWLVYTHLFALNGVLHFASVIISTYIYLHRVATVCKPAFH